MSIGPIVANRYRLEQILGRGGQATVHRAVDLKTGRAVAVKELDGQLSRDPTVVARLAREQQAMVALAGTSATEFIDLCNEPDGSLYLVMELLEGRDLETHLVEAERAKRLLPVEEVIRLMQPVVETLDRAHAVGIVHRDLKPANIFLLSPRLGGGTRLLDFGLAHLATAEALTTAGLIMGSPSYIAPESWAGVPGRAGAPADVYALSVILFRMLGGRMPFEGKSLLEKMKNATRAERPSLHELRNELPPQVDIWVERALAVDPSDRFASPGACFGELLWALKLAQHPSEQQRPQLSKEQADEVRHWLEADAPKDSIPQALLSLDPKLLCSVTPGESAPPADSEPIPFVSVEPMPLSDSQPEARLPESLPARKAPQAATVLPPIPRAPAIPEKEVSAAFSRSPQQTRSAPSIVPERSGVRSHDDWDDATTFLAKFKADARVKRGP